MRTFRVRRKLSTTHASATPAWCFGMFAPAVEAVAAVHCCTSVRINACTRQPLGEAWPGGSRCYAVAAGQQHCRQQSARPLLASYMGGAISPPCKPAAPGTRGQTVFMQDRRARSPRQNPLHVQLQSQALRRRGGREAEGAANKNPSPYMSTPFYTSTANAVSPPQQPSAEPRRLGPHSHHRQAGHTPSASQPSARRMHRTPLGGRGGQGRSQ